MIGTGGRSSFFFAAMVKDFPETSELVAFCDTNQTRMNHANSKLEAMGHHAVPTYNAVDFDRMIEETHPHEVIVTTMDRVHTIFISSGPWSSVAMW